VGDLKLSEITREHALKYHRYWSGRVSGAHGDGKAAKPNTANRHLCNMRLLYSAYYKHVGEENRQNPFRNLFFKAKSRTDVPAFPDEWVRGRILAPGALIGIRAELQLITYLLIETGCRPSEIINLQPGDIRMDAEIPYISIRPREAREIKTESSIRDIPLVGVALEAARRSPTGFPHYHDRSEGAGVGAIEVGIEDFASSERARRTAAIRNLYAGILLLCKHLLVKMAPDEEPLLLISAKTKFVENDSGHIQQVAVSRMTISVNEIIKRFVDLDLGIDVNHLLRLRRLRNEIEHFSTSSRESPSPVCQLSPFRSRAPGSLSCCVAARRSQQGSMGREP
jgi:integrase